MKRFSKTVLTVLLAGLIAFTAIGCATTVEEIAPAVVPAPAPVVEETPAPAPAPQPAPEPEVAPEPAPEVAAVPEPEPEPEPEIVYPYGVTPIVKNEQGDEEFDLFIVHTNDVHGRVSGDMERGKAIGYPVLSTLLNAGRAITDNILVLDAGDTLHGTNFANITRGESIGNLLVMLGYDAIAPGNHDFNYGTDRLVELSEMAERYSDLKVLSANITDDDDYLMFQPYQIYDFNGFDVAVIGLTTPDTKTKSHPKNTEGVNFMSDIVVDNAQKAIDIAHEYADYVIVLAHVGTDKESSICAQTICEYVDGIDLFVDGHSHTSQDALKKLLGEDQKVNGTTIVSAGEYMKSIGLVQLHVKNGEVTAIYPMTIDKADVANVKESDFFAQFAPVLAKFGIDVSSIEAIPGDPEVQAYIDSVNAVVSEKLDVPVAEIPMDLDGERSHVRTKKTNLSKLICEAITADTGADFTITNGGGIRSSIPAGIVTLGQIYNAIPFDNTISVCEMTGNDIWDAFEYGFSALPEEEGMFPQTDLQVIFSRSADPYHRIKRIRLNGVDILRDDTVYKVATNDFMAAGGDGYTMFGKELSVGVTLKEVFADYLAEIYPISK